MNQYIKADFLRIAHKKTHILSVIILALILPVILTFCMVHFLKFSGEESLVLIVSFSQIFIGVSIFSAVFADDFRSKTMQVAIGRGLSREQVILAKELELLLLTLLYTVIMVIGVAVTAGILGSPISVTTNIAGNYAGNVLSCMGFYNLAMIPVYITQKSNMGEIAYVLLSGGIIGSIVSVALAMDFLPKFVTSLSKYLFSDCVREFSQGLQSGNLLMQPLAGCIIWIVGALIITQLIFRKKELDF